MLTTMPLCGPLRTSPLSCHSPCSRTAASCGRPESRRCWQMCIFVSNIPCSKYVLLFIVSSVASFVLSNIQRIVTVLCIMAHIIFSTILEYNFAAYKAIIFSQKLCWLNFCEASGCEVQGHWGWNSCAFGIGFSSTPAHPELPPPSNPPNPIPPAQ